MRDTERGTSKEDSETYLEFGGGALDPYSWTCMPKKQTSTPWISSNAKIAFAMYAELLAISPVSQ